MTAAARWLAGFEAAAGRAWTSDAGGGVIASVASRPAPGGRAFASRDADDESLMASFCDGSEEAFAILFDRHAAAVRALALRLTGNRVLATDVTQATFLSVVNARHRFLPGSRFKPWLYTIAVNALRDQQRRARREVLSETGSLPEGAYEDVGRDLGLERAVHLALAQLPGEQREAVVLHQFEGFAFKEIARMVGATETAIKVRAHRGYERLRVLLKDAWGGR